MRKIGYIFDLFELQYYKYSGKDGSFRNRVNLQYKKTADLVLLRLFIKTNKESATIITPPSTDLSSIPLETNIPEGPIHEKNMNKYQAVRMNGLAQDTNVRTPIHNSQFLRQFHY